jgi:DNA-binding Xre family transcriptional regulator
MNITLLAADIARRIPELKLDSATNNADIIANLIREEIKAPKHDITQTPLTSEKANYVDKNLAYLSKDALHTQYEQLAELCRWLEVQCNDLSRDV